MKRVEKSGYARRVADLQALMEREGLDAYLVVSDDFHASEYVGDFFKCREFLSGFDGSAGEMVITRRECCLWTDGRYFLQAQDQLEGTGIRLMKMREPGVPTVSQYLAKTLSDGQTLGFDGRCVSCAVKAGLEKAFGDKNIRIRTDLDLVGEIWTDRPDLSAEKAWLLDPAYTGVSRTEKIEMIREEMRQAGCDAHLMASLDDIAWTYQLRGGDIDYNPVVLAYSLITEEEAVLYANPEVFSGEIIRELASDGVRIKPYNDIYADLTKSRFARLLADRRKCNCALLDALPGTVEVTDRPNPAALRKAIKTETERANERKAHLSDGIAVTRIIAWLKSLQGTADLATGKVTELTVVEKLLGFRKESPDFLEESFAPIVACGEHGAIIHYEPVPETDAAIREDTFVLMDTGGQYLTGTTDITRTIVLGNATQEMKRMYTAVLKGNLDLGDAVFRKGCTGIHLDVLARRPLWELGADYNHGTGHGVGYLLNVHEGPQGIRLREADGCLGAAFEPGMLTSDEPGVYLPGRYGIRTENLMLCEEREKTEFGEFYGFETLTLVPYDLDAVLPEMLTKRERQLLNAYHVKVRELLAPHLNEAENAWLREATRPV